MDIDLELEKLTQIYFFSLSLPSLLPFRCGRSHGDHGKTEPTKRATTSVADARSHQPSMVEPPRISIYGHSPSSPLSLLAVKLVIRRSGGLWSSHPSLIAMTRKQSPPSPSLLAAYHRQIGSSMVEPPPSSSLATTFPYHRI